MCNSNNWIYSLLVSGNTLYVSEDFSGTSSLGGVGRQGFAAVNAATGLVFPTWAENVNGYVQTIGRVNDLLLAGGEFTAFTANTPTSRLRFAAWGVQYEDESTSIPLAGTEEGTLQAFPNPCRRPFHLYPAAGSFRIPYGRA